jgi:hypothetical protein
MQQLMEMKKSHEIQVREGLPEIRMERNNAKVNGQERGIG